MQLETKNLFKILSDIEQAEKKRSQQKKAQEKSTSAYRVGMRVFWWGIIAPNILAILLAALVALLSAPRWLLFCSISLLLLSYLAIFLYPLLGAWLYRGSIKAFCSAPFSRLLSFNVEPPMEVDMAHFPELVNLPPLPLQLGILELKSERASFEKRLSLLSGQVDKIGLIPGLLATLATIAKLGDQPSWVYALAYATVPLFLFAFTVHMTLIRYDRMIALLELALQHQEKEAKDAAPKASD